MIAIDGTRFRDGQGRTLMLRGVGLDGASKVPFSPDGTACTREEFFDHRRVSFVNRPFPLSEASEHFGRLREWGLTFLRFMITWEAVEHAGPGLYDEEYLDYLRAVAVKAGEEGLHLFIDPHQDVWSRLCGGVGAPGWTLEAAGFDIRRLEETGAAIVPLLHEDPLPPMIWPTNGGKLAAATMFTLFFGGSDFAPGIAVDDEPIQELLQRSYIAAITKVAERLRDVPCVIGYDTMNEPLSGYIGWRDLGRPGGVLLLGECPSPFQGMLLGAGIPVEVPFYRLRFTGLKPAGTKLRNASGRKAWREGLDCLWRRVGVWNLDRAGEPVLLRPEHFSRVGTRAIDFTRDYFSPFAERFAKAIRAVDPRAMIFLEAESGLRPPRLTPDGAGIAFAPHWYDGVVMMRKRFSPFLGVDSRTRRLVFGRRAVRRSFRDQLAAFKTWAAGPLGGIPTVLGEFGIPFDLDGGRAFRRGDYRAQAEALDRSFRAVEENLLNAALFNYTSTNTNARGDGWNGEDFSIFSRDRREEPETIDSGGRALEAVVRPYPRAVAGEPLGMRFDMRSRVFELSFRHDPAVSAPTEVFVPRLQYPGGCKVSVSDGAFEMREKNQTLLYRHGFERNLHTLRVTP